MNILKRFDWWIFLPIFIISNFGLLTLFSIVPLLYYSQLIFMLMGILFFILFTLLDYRIFYSLKYPFLFLAVFFLLITDIFGGAIRGSARWLTIFGIGIQPSEIFKPFIIIFITGYLTDYAKNYKKTLLLLALLIPLIFLILKQPDLGNVIIYVSTLTFLLIVEKYYKILLIAFLLFGILAPVSWNFLHDYQRQRLLTFVNPHLDPQGSGYNALQATISVGSGGFWGKGLGRGTQSHLQFLPEKHTDFAFASFAEEFGFVGSFILIILYSFFFIRLFLISQKCREKQSLLLCLGIFWMFFSQTVINIGMNIGLLPITGITLPFFSYGGSSILSSFIALGLTESIIRSQDQEQVFKIS